MKKMLEDTLSRYEALEKQLADPAVQADSQRMAAAAREHGSLSRLARKYKRYKEIGQQLAEAKVMFEGSDPDERELAEAEIPVLRESREEIWQELLDATIGGEDANRTRCVVEIRAGTGGDEAALFAGNLFQMYKKYAETKGWKLEILDASPTELGGFKELVLAVEGEGVYRELQYESGGHRVQRVPETEAKGRVHTSAATVAVLPEPEDVEVDIKPDDYRKDIYCASGPGGQHVNKTASAIRLTHLETGIVVAIQDEKSQHKNFAKALRLLKSRVYEAKKREEVEKRSQERKSLVGSGDRSQRIRTYNFPENRLTDHRINFTIYKLDQIIQGALEPVTEALIDHDRQQLRDSMGDGDLAG
ncbi:MAG: peptide chain release factor 1 [Planctomycetota bacterium]|nr:peptide chain release factor 1 [Planctomycetota bacterium]